jgi:hypothetical protein
MICIYDYWGFCIIGLHGVGRDGKHGDWRHGYGILFRRTGWYKRKDYELMISVRVLDP